MKNQLHEQVCVAYPNYKQFFQDIGRPTALYFWEHYPSPRLLRGKTVEELAEELIPVSHNQFSTRKCQIILDAIKAVGKGQDQATGIDIDFQKINQYHLWNVKKQDRVRHAQGAGQLGLKATFCSKDRENMVKF